MLGLLEAHSDKAKVTVGVVVRYDDLTMSYAARVGRPMMAMAFVTFCLAPAGDAAIFAQVKFMDRRCRRR